MNQQADQSSDSPLEIDDVLDVASEAVVNDGFDALSFRRIAARMDADEEDVAQLFDSVEQLMVAMLNREYSAMFRGIADNIERDPLAGRLSRIYRYVLSGLYERPLARSLYVMDRDSLHRIMRATHGFMYIPQFSIRSEFIDRMKSAGVVRLDADSTAVSAVISAVSAGIATMVENDALDDAINGLALFLERAVDTDQTDTRCGKAVFLEYAMSLAGRAGPGDKS